MKTIKICWIFFVIIIFSSLLFNNASAQNDDSQSELKTIGELDDLLSTQVTATLTGLSLAGATFLVRTFKDEENELKIHTHQAQKNFIKSFVMFLMSTIAIFIFDFLEILIKQPQLYALVLDLIITYGFFSVGIVYLIKSAREIHLMYKNN